MAGERGIFDVPVKVKRGKAFTKPDLDELLRRLVLKAAYDVEARAKQRITDVGAVDTGSTRASIYVRYGGRGGAPLGSYYGRLAEARAISPQTEFLDPGMPDVGDGHAALIGPSTNYAAYIEFGTVRMPARPYMVPALEDVRGGFEAAVAAAITQLGNAP